MDSDQAPNPADSSGRDQPAPPPQVDIMAQPSRSEALPVQEAPVRLDENHLPPLPNLPEKAPAKAPNKAYRRDTVVILAIIATVIIVLGLSCLAVFAYIKSK